MAEAWSMAIQWDPTTEREGLMLTHMNGQPPAHFKAMWPRAATRDDILDAFSGLLDDLRDYRD